MGFDATIKLLIENSPNAAVSLALIWALYGTTQRITTILAKILVHQEQQTKILERLQGKEEKQLELIQKVQDTQSELIKDVCRVQGAQGAQA